MLTSSRSRPIELTANPQDWELNTSLTDDIDAVGQVYRAEAFIEDSNQERMPYILRGFDQGFASHGGLPLYQWDEQLGDDETEVWENVRLLENVVILDASFGLEMKPMELEFLC